jgi:hypothetical protein
MTYLTQDQINEVEREVMQRRGERARAAEAAKGAADAASAPPPVDRIPIVFGDPPLTPAQIFDFASTLRSTYTNYDDELIALKETKLFAFAAKSGVTLPPLPPADREKILLARHAAKGK